MLFVLLAVMTVSGAADAPSSAAGLQALDRHDYATARQIFADLAAKDSKDYSALFNLALAESGLNDNGQAVSDYRKVLNLKPDLYPAEVNLGILLLRQHEPADAIPVLRQAAGQKPNDARTQRYLGDALLATGDYNAAASAFEAARTADPKMGAAELGWGQALLHQDKLDEAQPHYRRAVELDPNLNSYLLELAAAYGKAGRAEDEIALLKLFPDNVGAREELGRIYLATGKAGDAVAEFSAAVAASPTSSNRVALASAYLKNNQPDVAAPLLKHALAADPNDYDLHMVVGRLYRDKHEYNAAGAQFTEAAQLKPDSVEAWNELASVLVLGEHYPEALAALDRVRSLHAETAGDVYYRAIVLDKLHQVKPALASYRQFLEESKGKFPDQEFIARQRARILEKEAGR